MRINYFHISYFKVQIIFFYRSIERTDIHIKYDTSLDFFSLLPYSSAQFYPCMMSLGQMKRNLELGSTIVLLYC